MNISILNQMFQEGFSGVRAYKKYYSRCDLEILSPERFDLYTSLPAEDLRSYAYLYIGTNSNFLYI